MSKKGIIVVISGPSGGGKGTVVKALREMMPDLGVSVSATTRSPREGEEDGREYYFMNRDDFEDMVSQGELFEYTTYCGNYYGTLRKEAERITGNGKDLILEIEVDGACQVKNKFPDAVTVMLIPPSAAELEDRLRGRGTENDSTVMNRLARAKEEIRLAGGYDYVVVNRSGMVDECAKTITGIISAEHSRASRMVEEIDNFFEN